MGNTELRQLRHVVALGTHLSFTKAADEVGITQSALTRSIQSIEEKAKVRLFDRDRGRVSVTEVGRVYLARAASLLQEADDLDRLLFQTAAAEVGEVHFGITSALARAILPQVLTGELRDRPQLNRMIHIRSPETLVSLVQSEQIEFCVCGEQPVLPASLKAHSLGTFPLQFLVRAGHPLLDRPEQLDFRDYPLVLSGQMKFSKLSLEFVWPLLFAPPRIIMDEIGTLAQITANSDALWMSIPSVAADELKRGLLRELPMPTRPNLKFKVTAYSHSRRTLSPAAQRLVELLRAQANQPFDVWPG